MAAFPPRSVEAPATAFRSVRATLVPTLLLAIGLATPAGAVGPYWHVDTFNAANLGGPSGNHAMWSGVPQGTPGYATAPGYGNGWDDRLYWRATVPNPTQPTQVRLRFVFNYDLQMSADFFLVEYQAGPTFAVRAQISGSNKNPAGQFITPATFDQTWTVNPGQYGGPLNDQVVLRLRVLTGTSGSDQDGGYNSSGAVQVDNVLVELNGNPAGNADFEPSGSNGGWTPFDRQAVAEYVRDNILGGSYGNVNLWMTQMPVDQTHVARDRDPQVPDLAMPYPLTWFVVIDDDPTANWAHPCRWVAVRADLGAHSGPISKQMPGTIWAGQGSGPQVDIGCAGLTPVPCPTLEVPPSVGGVVPGPEGPCLHAVLITGGVNEDFNFPRYTTNITSMYRILRELGYARENIHVFYEDGSARDLDNLDGDGDHATGSDIEDAADETAIRDRVSGLCNSLDRRKDVLFIYGTDHGAVGGDLELWDFNGNGWTDFEERYSPTELAQDTENCRVCRLFVLMDQCYSGAFVGPLTDADHRNSAVYTAASAVEVSFGRDYMLDWEDFDHAATTMNDMHDAVTITSHKQMGEGTPGNGDTFLNFCWPLESCYVPAVTPFCSDDASQEIGLVICNLRDEDHTYDLAFAGDPVDVAAGCTIGGPAGFTVLDPTPVSVPAGACARVRVRVDRPADMDAMLETGCYTATVTNRERGNTFTCHGTVVDQRLLCPGWLVGADPFFMPQGEPRTVKLRLTNTGTGGGAGGPQAALAYQFTVTPSEAPEIPNTIVGLNGMPPGTPVTGSVLLPPPGGFADVEVTVQLVQPDPEFFHDLRFMADVDGNGQPETLITLGLHQATAPVGVTPGAPGRLRLTMRPNPVQRGGEILFALQSAAPVRLEVADLQGRRVRTLVRGSLLAPGPQQVAWDGADDSGRPLPAGIYLIRLATPRGVETAKAVVMR